MRETFEEERRGTEKRRNLAKTFLSDLRDLKVGDLVVHVDHGIGEFVGLKQIGVGDAVQEFLELHYAGEDDRINAGIPAYKEALQKTGVGHQIFMYDGAQHAFNNDTSAARYDKKAADLAWARPVGFLKEKVA